MRFQALCEAYERDRCGHWAENTREGFRYRVASLSRFLDRLPSRTDREQRVFRECINRWQTCRRAEAGARTFSGELSLLKAICGYALEEGYMLRNPAAPLKGQRVGRSPVAVPTVGQYTELVEWLLREHPATGRYVQFLALSGFRKSEAGNAVWSDVDFAANTIKVYRVKSRLLQVLPMSAELVSLLLSMFDQQHPTDDQRIVDASSCRYWFFRASDALQQPRWHEHSMRHYFCSRMIEKYGADKADIVAELAGHSDPTLVLKVYSERARQVIQKTLSEPGRPVPQPNIPDPVAPVVAPDSTH